MQTGSLVVSKYNAEHYTQFLKDKVRIIGQLPGKDVIFTVKHMYPSPIAPGVTALEFEESKMRPIPPIMYAHYDTRGFVEIQPPIGISIKEITEEPKVKKLELV